MTVCGITAFCHQTERRSALLKGTMLATGARGDVDELAGLDEVDPMPDPLGYDQRLAGPDLDVAMTTFELEANPDPLLTVQAG
jgi:hypothetical protein